MDAIMSAPNQLQPAPDFADPRLLADFQPEQWPLCNGAPAPAPDAPDLHDRRCLEFLAAFYRLNILNSRLLAERTRRGSAASVQSLLLEIETATSALEELEDRYAPIGFFGEPVMEGIRYTDITFVRPELPRIYPKVSSVSSHIAIPGLDEIPESELRGPVKVTRWSHEKMDL